jgi:hypothetical protein
MCKMWSNTGLGYYLLEHCKLSTYLVPYKNKKYVSEIYILIWNNYKF